MRYCEKNKGIKMNAETVNKFLDHVANDARLLAAQHGHEEMENSQGLRRERLRRIRDIARIIGTEGLVDELVSVLLMRVHETESAMEWSRLREARLRAALVEPA